MPTGESGHIDTDTGTVTGYRADAMPTDLLVQKYLEVMLCDVSVYANDKQGMRSAIET